MIVHCRGGPAHGRVYNRGDAGPVPLAYMDGGQPEGVAEYRRRQRRFHPAGFVRRTGGPDAGHWIFDHDGDPPPVMVTAWHRASNFLVEDFGWVLVATVARRLIDQARAFTENVIDVADCEWEITPDDSGEWACTRIELQVITQAPVGQGASIVDRSRWGLTVP